MANYCLVCLFEKMDPLVVKTGSCLGPLVADALARENIDDDAEGCPLLYTPPCSPKHAPQTMSISDLSDLTDLSKEESGETKRKRKKEGSKARKRRKKRNGELESREGASAEGASRDGKIPGNHRSRGNKNRRKLKRQADSAKITHPAEYTIPRARSNKFQDAESVETRLEFSSLPIAEGGHVGIIKPAKEDISTLAQLIAEGFEIEEWDGL